MRRLFGAVLICVIIVGAITAFFMWKPGEDKIIPRPQVGIFYYAWYGALESDWKASWFVDFPISDLGNYSSLNRTAIQKQLVLIEDLGVDFVVISWWGFDDDYERFVDAATKIVFETAQSINSTLKFAVMVEPTHSRPDSSKLGEPYDYSGIYSHIYDKFVVPYSWVYYNHTGGKPLICFFNNGILTPNGIVPKDDRFNVVLVGTESYVQWVYTYLTNQTQGPHTTQTSVTTRYDNSRMPEGNSNLTTDPKLTEGNYDKQWQDAIELVGKGKIDTILITSWNEYL